MSAPSFRASDPETSRDAAALASLTAWIAARSLDPSVSAKFAAVPAPPPAVERRLPGQDCTLLAGHDSQAGAA